MLKNIIVLWFGHNLYENQENLNEEEYNKLLSIDGNKMIGYLKIPKIDVRLPIYHNTDQSTLSLGIGHFKGTSLPVPRRNGSHSFIRTYRASIFKIINRFKQTRNW
jgi:sortase A